MSHGNEQQLPLTGVRVVELATYIAAPAAATIMSDYGASVIKVEPPGMGDPYRYLYRVPPMPESEINYCWVLDGRNKRSISLNLKQPAAHAVVLKLVAQADVVVTNYHPSVLAQLNLTYATLSAHNPRLIYAHVSGYGQHGPLAEQPGYDMSAFWARSGLMDAVAPADGDPALSVAGMGDHPTAMTLFASIMLALYNRDRTGKGTEVATSLLANGMWSNACLIQASLCGAKPYQKAPRSQAHNVLINHYVTADGKRILLCSLATDRAWPALCAAIEQPALATDPRFCTPEARRERAGELVAILDAAFGKRDFDHWATTLDRHGLVWSPVHQIKSLLADPNIGPVGALTSLDHPTHGPLQTIANPIHIADAPQRPPGAAPAIGQHTREVLASLGYGEEEIQKLIDGQVAACGGQA